ncbi:complement C1q subcomponent subunit B-like [Mercenaria mercenaria]|uniref:complement C1q subcomponent subunit B-like n=1 Tax=Mercenaria mercenaria TaxID=6596 RepID=UPI00234F78AA|nr:complement C1q subcomponent subunit B-like [Mercenaria mercenaria]
MLDDYNEIRNELANKTSSLEEIVGTPVDTQKVAFNAYTTSGGSYNENQTVVFPHVLLNAGGGYNNITGDFTAPTAGLYYFSAHICHVKGAYMVVSIVYEGKEIAITTEYEGIQYSFSSVSAPAIMKAGEKVFIQSAYAHSKIYADTGYRWPSFPVVLVNNLKSNDIAQTVVFN